MIADLRGRGQVAEESDVVVIRAGFAGLFTALRLQELGLRTTIIEAGLAMGTGGNEALEPVEFMRNELGSGGVGRAAGIGGTSSLWGGALLPMAAPDLETDALNWGIAWPVSLAELEPFGKRVEQLFGLPDDNYVDPSLSSEELVVRLPKWPTFARRNIARLFERQIAASTGPRCWVNASASGVKLTGDGRLSHVQAQADDGSTLTVRARKVIVAAGVVESTRFLLNADRMADGRLFGAEDFAGGYLHDHLSAYAAKILPHDRGHLSRLSAFRFHRTGMRSVRFEPSGEARNNYRLSAGLAHILFTNEVDGPFEALRDIYRGLQRRDLPNARQAIALAKGLPWFAHATYERFVRKRLLAPTSANYVVNLVVEQRPLSSNRISLTDKIDRFGIPTARVDWSPSSEDCENYQRLADFFAGAWVRAGYDRAGKLELRNQAAGEILQSPGTIHAGGTLRMAAHRRDGVVDANLSLFDCPDITVASTAVFPRTGGANPTFTLLALALRLADRIAVESGFPLTS